MIADIPTFAVVGAVNHGKSSVVAALAEDEGVRVSSMPGETVVNQRFSMRDLLAFFDTPGFQNARKALAAIEALGVDDHGDSLEPFRRFITDHRNDADFEAECRLLQPIVDGAGIIYVVDASRPLRDMNLCEMEILRRTGAPRLAIINRTGHDDRVDEWKGKLDQHFNIVRAFDAHRASYADRKDLVESLASIERGWKDRLREAARLMDADRRQRLDDCAALIADLLVDCLQHAESVRIDAAASPAVRDEQTAALKAQYMASVAAIERKSHQRIIAVFAHSRVTPESMPADVFGSDLFGEETWQVFGLGARKLMGLSTVAGGIAGAGIDAATLGHSFGVGAVVGAAAGAGGAYFLGKKRPELSIDWPASPLPGVVKAVVPKSALRFSGGELVVGPYKAENFPWILIDRALCVFADASTRSHARRDDVVVDVQSQLARLNDLHLSVEHWSDAARTACQSVFRGIRRRGPPGPEQMTALKAQVRKALDRVSSAG